MFEKLYNKEKYNHIVKTYIAVPVTAAEFNFKKSTLIFLNLRRPNELRRFNYFK